jgi:hypothetical protein
VNFSTQTEVAALVLTIAVHIVGAAVLIWGMIDHDDPDRGSWRDWWPRDDRGDDGPPADPTPKPSGDTVVPILPQSTPPAIRIREGGRIGDLTPRPARRPAHPAPAPVPERVPARDAD